MHAWPASDVPALPGTGRDLRIHDTATGGLVTVDPGPVARIYVCGITPYDATHMGHAATYNAFDLVQRVWLDTKRQVHYVQNVTDVDDPLLERADARRRGLDRPRRARDRAVPRGHDRPADAAAAALHRRRRGRYPASCRWSSGCGTRGAAYELDGDIYFSVESDPRFGGVSRLDAARHAAAVRRARRRPGPPGQEEPARPDAVAGRPRGRAELGRRLARPRPARLAHRVRRPSPWTTSAWASTSRAAAPTWPSRTTRWAPRTPRCSPASSRSPRRTCTPAWSALDGEKMSKSKGNLVFVSRLRRDGVDPAAIRLALLAHHYRADWEWTDDGPATRRRPGSAAGGPRSPGRTARRPRRWSRRSATALADDLDAPAALAAVDRWAARQQSGGGTDERRPRAGVARGGRAAGRGALASTGGTAKGCVRRRRRPLARKPCRGAGRSCERGARDPSGARDRHGPTRGVSRSVTVPCATGPTSGGGPWSGRPTAGASSHHGSRPARRGCSGRHLLPAARAHRP